MAFAARGIAVLLLVSASMMAASGRKTYPSASGEGKTTRFWDCCKVTCAWRANAGAVTAPVATCAAGGVKRVGENEQSGCNGGNAFVCNNQQPFTKRDGKAYGFAAANVNGLPTNMLCCACYKLRFTDTNIKGKEMIVQVINTGSDLGNNHFDLMIPGGGEGIFTQGCAKQWPFTPAQNWGAQYGGVKTKAEGGRLPKELQPGNNFHYGWFGGADNPHVHFERVSCPKVLVNRSGCRRHDD